MFPANARVALLEQLQTERAVEELTMLAYRYWLPLASAAAVPSLTADISDEVPPDPSGIAETTAAWEALLDGILITGLGLIGGYTVYQGFLALTGEPPVPIPPVPVSVPPTPTPTGVPDMDQLAREAQDIVTRRMDFDADDFAEKLRALPQIRQLQADYLAGVRNRMVNTPDTVFREIAKAVDEGLANGDSPLTMREAVQKQLDINTGDWPGRATTVARTESAGAQSAATVQAAQLRNEVLGEDDLQQVWIATIDGKTRKAHFAADGQRVPLGGTFSVGTDELRYPGDPLGRAGNVINCRCRVAVLAADDPLPVESDRQTERGPGDATVRNRDGSRQDEIDRRAADGTIRAREDPDGVGIAASAADMLAETTQETPMTTFRSFTSVLAVIGKPTDDGRIFADDIALDFRPFPLPLMWQKQTMGGHSESFTVGVIQEASVADGKVIGSGYFLNSPEAVEAMDQAGHKVTAPSVDLGNVDWELRDEDGNTIEDMEVLWDNPDMKVVETVLAGKMLGATLVSIAAFSETSITLGTDVEIESQLDEPALVASMGLATAPVHPAEFFTDPGFTEATLPHITDDGRIQGHLAAFNVCHVGIQDSCVVAPRSQTDYAWFHTSPPVRTSGGKVKVGRLTVGGGHAGQRLSAGPAIAHYDETGTCFALVHVGEDEHGIWFSGVPAPGATEAQVQEGLSAPLSGDWRNVGGSMELVAALAVNTPGFPIIASGATDADDMPYSLVASLGPCPAETRDETKMRAMAEQIVLAMRKAERRQGEARRLVATVRKSHAQKLISEVKDVRVQKRS